MEKPMSKPSGMPLYHWAEWPLATLMALLLAGGIWYEPATARELFARAFEAVSLVLGGWSTYLEWRRGALSRGFAGIREGIQNEEHPFIWLHRRMPLRLVWLALIVMAWWHF
jgi:hypothetical protein